MGEGAWESKEYGPLPGRRGSLPVKILVVLLIAIVAIAGIGYLANQARTAARDAPLRARCESNLRRIGQAVMMYAQEFDGTLPTSGSSVGGDVAGRLEPYTKETSGRGIWRCPAQSPFAAGEWTSSYGYNWQYLLAPGPDYPHNDWNGLENGGIKLSSIADPGRTLMFVDHKPVVPESWAKLWSYVVRPGQKLEKPENLDGMGRVDLRHNGNANVLFCDGHVALRDGSLTDPGREKDLWDPR